MNTLCRIDSEKVSTVINRKIFFTVSTRCIFLRNFCILSGPSFFSESQTFYLQKNEKKKKQGKKTRLNVEQRPACACSPHLPTTKISLLTITRLYRFRKKPILRDDKKLHDPPRTPSQTPRKYPETERFRLPENYGPSKKYFNDSLMVGCAF